MKRQFPLGNWKKYQFTNNYFISFVIFRTNSSFHQGNVISMTTWTHWLYPSQTA